MQPTIQLKWLMGLKKSYASIGATQRDTFSWVAKSEEHYVFSAELDHINPADNQYDHKLGVFYKKVPPMSTALGDKALSISHSKELYDAIFDAFSNSLKCRILLVKGTKYGTASGPIKGAVDGHFWQVTDFSGDVLNGYSFKIVRVE